MTQSTGQSVKTTTTKKEFLLFMSVPVAIMVIVVAVVLLPSWLAHPKYDFIYSYCSEYNCASNFQVTAEGVVTLSPRGGYNYDAVQPQLYYYDVKHGTSRPITAGQANGYRLDTANVSPDGYKLTQNTDSGGGFLFWGGSGDYNWYLKHGSQKKAVNLANNTNYGDSITFLGWIE